MAADMFALIARVETLARRFATGPAAQPGTRGTVRRDRLAGARPGTFSVSGGTSEPPSFNAALAGALGSRRPVSAAGSIVGRTALPGSGAAPVHGLSLPQLQQLAGVLNSSPVLANAGSGRLPGLVPPAAVPSAAPSLSTPRTAATPHAEILPFQEHKEPGQDIVELARTQVGKPYRWGGGRTTQEAFDCSGLAAWVYRQTGRSLPAFTDTAFAATVAVDPPRPGDLVFFQYQDPSQPGVRYPHLGIFAGEGQMIDASTDGGVQVRALLPNPLFRRLPEEALPGDAAAPAAAQPTEAAVPIPAGQAGLPFGDLIARVAEQHGIDPSLITAIVRAESGFNPRAVSPAGAKGLMQLMDGTARQVGVSDPFEPEQNLAGGVRYLRWLLDRYQNDPRLALAAYNAGPGAVDRYGGVPPFSETRAYLSRVLSDKALAGPLTTEHTESTEGTKR